MLAEDADIWDGWFGVVWVTCVKYRVTCLGNLLFLDVPNRRLNIDHVNPPGDDSIQSVTSPAEWLIGGGLVRGGGAVVRAVAMCRSTAASGLGDLTVGEIRAIQSVVDRAQKPLNVVGSAAKGLRRGVGTDFPIGKGIGTRSDIDYVAPPYGLPYFNGLQEYLPSIDPNGGISPGLFNPYEGPSVRFEPGSKPFFIPGK